MKLNTQTLNNWIAVNGPHGREALSYKSGLGFYTIGRLLRQDRPASKTELLALIQATGLSECELLLGPE